MRPHSSRANLALLAAAALLVIGTTGGATAAIVISGKQIKNNTVTSKDVKDGSLKVVDFKKSERAKLRGATGATGPAGPAGAAGARGADFFSPLPAGVTVTGGGILDVHVSGAATLRGYSPLPFTTTTALTGATEATVERPTNMFFGAGSPDPMPGEIDATRCPGSFASPTTTPGTMCVYLNTVSSANISDGVTLLFGGATFDNGGGVDGANRQGFYVYPTTSVAGPTLLRWTWAYAAP